MDTARLRSPVRWQLLVTPLSCQTRRPLNEAVSFILTTITRNFIHSTDFIFFFAGEEEQLAAAAREAALTGGVLDLAKAGFLSRKFRHFVKISILSARFNTKKKITKFFKNSIDFNQIRKIS